MANIALVTADNYNGGASRATRRIAKGLTEISLKNTLNFELVCNGLPEVGYIQKKPFYNWYTDYLYKNNKIQKVSKILLNKIWQKVNVTNQKEGYLFFREGNSINYKKTFDKYDLIHIFWGQTFINSKKIANMNKPTVVTLHDMWFLTGGFAYSENPFKDKSKYLSWLGKKNFDNQLFHKIRLLNKSTTKIVVTSDWMANKVIELGFKENKMTKISNYIPKNFRYLDDKKKCRELLNWSSESNSKKIIYFSGSLFDPRKGFQYLLQSIMRLKDEVKSKIAIQILGYNSSKIEALEEAEVEYNCLGIFSDELSQVIAYNAADLLFCTSSFDNSPNVIAEAHMCGLPCVAFKNTGGAEMIDDGFSGFIAPKREFTKLDKYIKGIVERKINFDNAKISEWAKEKYSIEKTCQKYLDLYKTLL